MITLILIALYKKIFFANTNELSFIKSFISHKVFRKLITVIFLCSPLTGISQSLSYSVSKGKNEIGTLTATREGNGNKIKYVIKSSVKCNVIINLYIDVLMEETFESGLMINSLYIMKINDNIRMNNIAGYQSGGYVLKRNKEEGKSNIKLISYSMGSMYFSEPVSKSYVFSEKFQQFVKIKNEGNGRYLVVFPNGTISYYTYTNGICSEIEAHTEWTVIRFRLNDQSGLLATGVTKS